MRRLPFGFQQLLITLVGFLMLPGMFGEQIGLLLPLMFTLVLVSCLYLVAENRSQLLIVCILAVPPLLTNFQLGLFDDSDDIVFVHTGGIFGLFPQREQLQQLFVK